MKKLSLFLLGIFIYTIPVENSVIISGVGSINRLLGLISFCISLIYIVSIRRTVKKMTLFMLLSLTFLFWVSFTIFWSYNIQNSLTVWLTAIQIILMIQLINEVVDTKNDLLFLIKAFLLGIFTSVISIILSFINGVSYTIYDLRFTAFGTDPNDVGVTLAIAIPILWYLILNEKDKVFLLISKIFFPLIIFSIVLTGSRGALLTAIVALLIIPFTYNKLKTIHKILTLIIFSVLTMILIKVVPVSVVERIFSIRDELSSGNVSNRTDLWYAGLKVFSENPIQGVGIGAFADSVQSYLGYGYVAHNTFISILVEQGLVGFCIFLLILVYLFVNSRNLENKEYIMWRVVIVTWCIGVFSLTWEFQKVTWLIFSFISIRIYQNKSPAVICQVPKSKELEIVSQPIPKKDNT